MIIKLTAAQEQRLEEVRSEWLSIGRSTAPLNRERVCGVLTEFYQRIGKPAPVVLFFSSPAICILAYGILKNFRSQLGSQLGSQLESQLRSQLESQLGSQLESQLRSQLGSQLESQLGNYFAGNQWCAWEVFYHFCQEIGATYSSEQTNLLDLWVCQACEMHWWFPYEGLVLVSERPEI